jgi:hypothetical protein
VSDIFHEVDEEVRREQLKKLWERWQNYVIGAVLLLLIGVGGWRGYEWWETRKAAEFGTAFETAMVLSAEGKSEEAETAFAKIATEGTPSYRNLARMRQAAELAKRDAKAAIEQYGRVAADGSAGIDLQDLAGLRAGALLMDAGSLGEARSRLEPLTGERRPYRHTARELLAMAAWREGDMAAAKRWLDLINTDLLTPAATRQRVEMLNALMAAEDKS